MIVKKMWMKMDFNNHDLSNIVAYTKEISYEGYYLFGFIPLYIKQINVKYK